MADMPKLPNKVVYEYSVPDDLHTAYAHGVWGGVNPHGEIELSFYTESDKIPLFAQRAILPDGSLGPEVTELGEDRKIIVREVKAKVLLNYHAAKAVIAWLEEKVRALEMESDHPHLFMDDAGPEQ
ncbi:MAG: hypothetical protein AB7E47_01010 [Desulfovibrionaceae bacterium]